MVRRRLRRESRGEEGFSIMEAVVASSILLLALATFIASLGSSQSASSFATSRNRSLDELRLAASGFSREARQAQFVTAASATSVTFSTYVGGVLKDVTWETVTTAGVTDLVRKVGVTTRAYDLNLTTAGVFSYLAGVPAAPPIPASAPKLTLTMATKPKAKFPAVLLTTEVSLRNVS